MIEIFLWLLRKFPALLVRVNRYIINLFASSTSPRPHRFSLWTPSSPNTPAPTRTPASRSNSASKPSPISSPQSYTSWPSLVDRTFTARHLGPTDPVAYPAEESIVTLFRRNGEVTPNPRSTVLFCFFAQWFTDSFLRTHPTDPRRNTSNHEIDLCQIYGLDEPSTWALRAGEHGLLKSRLLDGFEFPPYLYRNGTVDAQFYDQDPVDQHGLAYLRGGRLPSWEAAVEGSLPGTISEPSRRDFFYASGLDRGGSTIAYSAFNVLFLREHNRIARMLAANNRGWDDNRLFETSRLINVRQMLTVVVNDYIRHIGGVFPFSLDRSFAEKKAWYRTNRISIEFNLLYRWHSLVPDHFTFAGRRLPHNEFRYNNQILEKHGIETLISDASEQAAGRIGLFNTPSFLEQAERRGLKWARDFGLQPFNRYRQRFGLTPYETIEDFADGDTVAGALNSVYKSMDEVEFSVGLFAEKRGERDVMPETLRQMVAYDAFTHILTNPVLSTEVHREETFSEVGWDLIQQDTTLKQIVERNCDGSKLRKVSLSL